VWRDFRDLFGIVWARRIQERFNEDARRAGLALRLGIDGLERRAGTASTSEFDSQSLTAAEASLRWLLQKFVEPAWIDRRLEKIHAAQNRLKGGNMPAQGNALGLRNQEEGQP